MYIGKKRILSFYDKRKKLQKKKKQEKIEYLQPEYPYTILLETPICLQIIGGIKTLKVR